MHFKMDLQTQFLFILHLFQNHNAVYHIRSGCIKFFIIWPFQKTSIFLGKKAHFKKSGSRKYIYFLACVFASFGLAFLLLESSPSDSILDQNYLIFLALVGCYQRSQQCQSLKQNRINQKGRYCIEKRRPSIEPYINYYAQIKFFSKFQTFLKAWLLVCSFPFSLFFFED